jgi:rhodanese-related sulfurtransferase
MSGRIIGKARRLARHFWVAPVVALMFLSPGVAEASQGDAVIQQSVWGFETMWNFGGSGVGAAILLALALMWATPAQAQEHRESDGWTDTKSLARQVLEGQDVPALIDVREPDEFVGPLGHIKGAVNVPLNGLTSNPAQLALYKDKPVALICRTDRRASAAAFALRASGFKKVVVVRGGMTQWNVDGLPVERPGGRL